MTGFEMHENRHFRKKTGILGEVPSYKGLAC